MPGADWKVKFVPVGAERVQFTMQQSRAAATPGAFDFCRAFLQQSCIPGIGHSCPPSCRLAPLANVLNSVAVNSRRINPDVNLRIIFGFKLTAHARAGQASYRFRTCRAG
jgi:hypothetical protein